MVKGHRIEKKIEVKEFLDLIGEYEKEKVIPSKHAFFRLKEAQRKVFKEKLIKEFILGDTPILVGLQYNGNYAVFYEYGNNVIKIVLEISPSSITIVTFYILDKKQLPKIR